jgi:protein-disulfide isomerase
MKTHPVLVAATLVAVGLGASAALRTFVDGHQILETTPVVRAVLDDPDTPAAGAAVPDLTIVVFTDYRCPVCRSTDPALARLLERDPGVRVLIKDFPVLGPQSRAAARLALAAQRQGKYWPMHRALMDARTPVTEATLPELARSAGVDWAQLNADLSRHGAAIDATLNRHAVQAWSLGIEGTPGYLVGPLLVKGALDDRALAHAVAEARRSQGRA